MTHAIRTGFAEAIRGRYGAAANKDKRRILEEFVAATGYYKKVRDSGPERRSVAEAPADPSTPVALR
jgi:hypothetical protein